MFVLLLILIFFLVQAVATDFHLTNQIDYQGSVQHFLSSLARVRQELFELQLAVPTGQHRFIVSTLIPRESYFENLNTNWTPTYLAFAYERTTNVATTEEKKDSADTATRYAGNFYITQIGSDPNLRAISIDEVRRAANVRTGQSVDWNSANIQTARARLRATNAETWYDFVDSNHNIIAYQEASFSFNLFSSITQTALRGEIIGSPWARARTAVEQVAIVFAESLRNPAVAHRIADHMRSDLLNQASTTMNLDAFKNIIRNWDDTTLRFLRQLQNAYALTPQLFTMANLPSRVPTDGDEKRQIIDTSTCLSWRYWGLNQTELQTPTSVPTPSTENAPCTFLAQGSEERRASICHVSNINFNKLGDILLSWVYFDTQHTR